MFPFSHAMSCNLEGHAGVTTMPPGDRGARAIGYASPKYVRSLAEWGDTICLSGSGGSLLRRPISGSRAFDAMGPYPVFCCANWAELARDLEALRSECVSVTLVTDPFGTFERCELDDSFPELVAHYKDHYVVDLHQPIERIVCRHHQRNARKAIRLLDVSCCGEPYRLLDQWQQLYAYLVARHDIRGMRAFSRRAFSQQMLLGGCRAFVASRRNEIVGMLLWYVNGEVAYYHLGAYSQAGYDFGASFALFWFALTQLGESGVRWASLGAGAGADARDSGLTRFKRGWSTGTRPVYLCGRILQPDIYEDLRRRRGISLGSVYFPAYRERERA